jgi:hypothetical protein
LLIMFCPHLVHFPKMYSVYMNFRHKVIVCEEVAWIEVSG